MKKKKAITLGLISLSILFLIASLFFYGLNYGFGRSYQQKIYHLSDEWGSLSRLFWQLQQDDIIPNTTFIGLLSRLIGADKQAKTGSYLLNNRMGAWKVLDILTSGKEVLIPVLIREGDDLYEVAFTLHENKLVSTPQEALHYFHSEEAVRTITQRFHTSQKDLPLQRLVQSAEGFLYPDTYFVRTHETLPKLLKMMLDNFEKNILNLYKKLPDEEKTTMNWYRLLIIASLIEEETSYFPERPLVSSVIYNRLQKGMPLQFCVTLVYALKQQYFLNGNLVKDMPMRIIKKHFQFPSPYNTYLHEGLSPGPISSPSLNAFLSAVKPSRTGYYYFVAKADGSGSHWFSRTYKEHLKRTHFSQKRTKHPKNQ